MYNDFISRSCIGVLTIFVLVVNVWNCRRNNKSADSGRAPIGQTRTPKRPESESEKITSETNLAGPGPASHRSLAFNSSSVAWSLVPFSYSSLSSTFTCAFLPRVSSILSVQKFILSPLANRSVECAVCPQFTLKQQLNHHTDLSSAFSSRLRSRQHVCRCVGARWAEDSARQAR